MPAAHSTFTDACKHCAKCNAGHGLNTKQIWEVRNWSYLTGENLEIYLLHAMHVSEHPYCIFYIYKISPIVFHMYEKTPLIMRSIANVKGSASPSYHLDLWVSAVNSFSLRYGYMAKGFC